MTSITGNAYLDTLTSSSAKAKTTTTGSSTSASGQLDENSFLQLLTTQLKTQDPTAPVDNTQMVAQLAQFSSVAGISKMNTTLTSMASDISASRVGGASGWIGKTALVASDIVTPVADGSYNGQVTLPSDAKSVQITLTDASGNVVHQETLGATAKGDVPYSWDGKASDGTTATATGPLAVTVSAYSTAGRSMTPTIASWVPVKSVESPSSGDTKLNTALGSVSPSDVIRLG